MSEEVFSRWQDPTIDKLQQENSQLKEEIKELLLILKLDENKVDELIAKANEILKGE